MASDFGELRKSYVTEAIRFLRAHGKHDAPMHVVDIIVSVMMHRDNVMPGGGFVQAICRNELREAIGRADNECEQYLKVIALSYAQAYTK